MAGMSLPVEPKIEIAGLNNAEQNCEEATFNYQEYDQKELIGLIEFWADCYGVNKQLALDLAEHESMFNSLAKNSEGSSAKGIYQFLDSTWASECSGDVFSPDDNIQCGMRLLGDGSIGHWLADKRVANYLRSKGHIK